MMDAEPNNIVIAIAEDILSRIKKIDEYARRNIWDGFETIIIWRAYGISWMLCFMEEHVELLRDTTFSMGAFLYADPAFPQNLFEKMREYSMDVFEP